MWKFSTEPQYKKRASNMKDITKYISYTNGLFSIDNRIDEMFLKMTGLKRLYGEC